MFGLRYISDVTTLKLDVDKCNGCKMCLYVCPHAVLAVSKRKAQIVDADACMECGACAMNCPENALSVRAGVGCAYAIIVSSLKGIDPAEACCDDATCC